MPFGKGDTASAAGRPLRGGRWLAPCACVRHARVTQPGYGDWAAIPLPGEHMRFAHLKILVATALVTWALGAAAPRAQVTRAVATRIFRWAKRMCSPGSGIAAQSPYPGCVTRAWRTQAHGASQRPPRKGRPAALAVSPFPNGIAVREKGEGAKRLRGLYSPYACSKWKTAVPARAFGNQRTSSPSCSPNASRMRRSFLVASTSKSL